MTGTRILGNSIQDNFTGILMQDTQGITVGSDSNSQVVSGNTYWGLIATGHCQDSILYTGDINNNRPGNVNTSGLAGSL